MVTFTGFPAEAFDFYERLAADNSKAYWTAHKALYDNAVRGPLIALAADLEKEFGEAKVFRPHRDVRFAADKSPYKTHQGAFCQVADGVGFYIQIDAEGVMIAGGFHAPGRDETLRYRAAIDRDETGAALERVLAKLTGKGWAIGGATVASRPRGCPADHPQLALMRHESLTVHRRYDGDERFTSPKALDIVRSDWRALRPLNDWVLDNVTAKA
ncbi:MAG: DUF2461 domain-containing protein [Anaerolineales bacterium]